MPTWLIIWTVFVYAAAINIVVIYWITDGFRKWP